MFEILYGDKDIAVVIKPCGVISEDGESSVCNLIRDALSVEDIYPIHRLDRDVSGVMVFALSKKAAAFLSKEVADGALEKIYLAVVHGKPSEDEGVFSDLLFKDSRKNKSYVVKRERKGVRYAELSYTCLKSDGERSLVRIKLHTGRSHQIRVQFSSRKMPLFGDKKYGASDDITNIALFSHRIAFKHPNGEYMSFSKKPSGGIWESLE